MGAAALVTTLASMPLAAMADAVADANAGADALAAGQYAKAVQLFTSAILSKKLSSDDLESAYVERGKAYLGEHENKLAAADFDRALKLSPGDQEAASLRGQAEGTVDTSAAATSPGSNARVRAEISGPLKDAISFAQNGNYAAATEKVLQASGVSAKTPAEANAITRTEAYIVAKAGEAGGDCAAAAAPLLNRNPYDPAVNYYLAGCFVRRGDYAGAALPLRLAVQYGGGVPEGQMAQDTAKRLAGQYSPRAGIAMGCAVPVAPTLPDGSTATREQFLAVKSQMDNYNDASSRFQACLQSGFADLQAQVAPQGRTYVGTALERKYQAASDQNRQEQQAVDNQFAAAISAYNAAH
jgi:tetratricopeptide (TPR) repeat protein